MEVDALPELAVPVTGIQIDSRELISGDLFIAYFGRNHDAGTTSAPPLITTFPPFWLSPGEWQGIRILRGKPVVAVDNLTAKSVKSQLDSLAGPVRR